MIEFSILNLEHSYKEPIRIKISHDIYVRVEKKHCQNLCKLSQPERTQFGFNDQNNRIVRVLAKVEGDWVETAVIEIEKAAIRESIINVDCPNDNTVDDLCYLLSFFTGRIVCRHSKKEYYNPKRYTDSTIIMHNWIFYLREYEKLLERLAVSKLNNSFYNLLMTFQSGDLLQLGYIIRRLLMYYIRRGSRRQVKKSQKV